MHLWNLFVLAMAAPFDDEEDDLGSLDDIEPTFDDDLLAELNLNPDDFSELTIHTVVPDDEINLSSVETDDGILFEGVADDLVLWADAERGRWAPSPEEAQDSTLAFLRTHGRNGTNFDEVLTAS